MKQQFVGRFARTATDTVAVGHHKVHLHVRRLIQQLQAILSLYQRNPRVDCIPPQWLASGRFHCHHESYLPLVKHEYMSARVVTFVLPNHCCHVTICPDPSVALFEFPCLASEVVWHSLAVWSDCTAAVCSVLSDRYISREKKRNCPYRTYGTPLYCCQQCHCSIGRCCVCCLVFRQVHFHVLRVVSGITQLENFNSECFVLLWIILFEYSLPFELYDHFVNCQMFRRVLNFGIRNIEHIKNSPNFPQCQFSSLWSIYLSLSAKCK